MIFTTEGFFEVAIESFPFRRSNRLSYHDLEFNSNSEPTLYSYSNFIDSSISVSSFISAIAFISRHVCFN